MRLKFIMAQGSIYFGICNNIFNNRGKIGRCDNNSWGWKCSGESAYHGTEPLSLIRVHTLGDL